MEIYAGQLNSNHLGKSFTFKQSNNVNHYKLHIEAIRYRIGRYGASKNIVSIEIDTYREMPWGEVTDKRLVFKSDDILEIDEPSLTTAT